MKRENTAYPGACRSNAAVFQVEPEQGTRSRKQGTGNRELSSRCCPFGSLFSAACSLFSVPCSGFAPRSARVHFSYTLLASRLALLLVLSFLLPLPVQAENAPFTIILQVYEGPHDGTGQKWKKKNVELVPGSDEAREFLENYRKSTPGLVQAYEMLTTEGPFLEHMEFLHSLDGKAPKLYLVDDSQKYVDADDDGNPDTDEKARDEEGVWPHRSGNSIYISNSYLGSYPNDANVQRLIIHEYSHSQDRTGRGSGDYGPDDSHFADEILYNHGGGWRFWDRGHYSERAAFSEGWANFTPILFDPDRRDAVAASVENVRRETEKGKYEEKDWAEASYEELIAVEYINSLILYDIFRYVPGGADKITEAFQSTNRRGRNLRTVLQEIVKEHPEDAFAIAGIFDAYTHFNAPDKVLDEMLGEEIARAYRRDHRSRLQELNTEGTASGAEAVGQGTAQLRIASVEARLAAIDERLDEIRGVNLSPWDILGGIGSIGFREFRHRREEARLRAEKQRLEELIKSLGGAVSGTAAARGSGNILGGALRRMPELRTKLMQPPVAKLNALRRLGKIPTKLKDKTRPVSSMEGSPQAWGEE